MNFGKFKLHFIRESSFKLDGGAMFGVVPKALWGKLCPSDELNRVPLACNSLLIETPNGRVLVDTGMGPQWSEKERERFELTSLVDHENFLASAGLSNEDVDAVIISHMHFDHIGGAVLERDGKPVPTFPKARYYVQKGEFEFAKTANSRARASYRSQDWEALESSGQLEIIDGDCEILPGVWAKVTGGHTKHHQVVYWETDGQHGVYFADIIPTAAHLSPPWVMGYDHFPLDTCDVKHEWLGRAAAEKWLVVFDHENGTPWGYVTEERGRFSWHPLQEPAIV